MKTAVLFLFAISAFAAEKTPEPKPPKESPAQLRATIARLEAELAEFQLILRGELNLCSDTTLMRARLKRMDAYEAEARSKQTPTPAKEEAPK